MSTVQTHTETAVNSTSESAITTPCRHCYYDKRHFLTPFVECKCSFCFDCGLRIHTIENGWEFYMVHNEIWNLSGGGTNQLCILCLENRIGRQLCKEDFTDCPANHHHKRLKRTTILHNRLFGPTT